jgi:hypothetical protein
MNRKSGGPAPARPSSRGFILLVATAALLVAAATCLPAPGFGLTGPLAAEDDAPTGDPRLDAAIRAIEQAFKERNANTIIPLVSTGGKVFLSFHSVGKETGYYGRDQVYFILQRVFREHRTTGFKIQIQTPQRQKTQALCTSHWVYSTSDGGGDVQIFFVFTAKNGQWSLVQIREAA